MKKSKKRTITVKTLAGYAGLTARRIYSLAEEGRLEKPDDGKLPFPECLTQLFKFYQRDPEELKREKLGLAKATREGKEFYLEVAKGKWIDREVATHTCMAAMIEHHNITKRHVTAICCDDTARKIIMAIESDCARIASGEELIPSTPKKENDQT